MIQAKVILVFAFTVISAMFFLSAIENSSFSEMNRTEANIQNMLKNEKSEAVSYDEELWPNDQPALEEDVGEDVIQPQKDEAAAQNRWKNYDEVGAVEEFLYSFNPNGSRIQVKDNLRYWIIGNFSMVVKDPITSDEFSLDYYPFKLQVKIHDFDNDFILSLKYIGDLENITMNPATIFVIKDHSGKSKHLIRSTHHYFSPAATYAWFQITNFIPYEMLISPKFGFRRNDTITMAMYMEPPSFSQQLFSTNGTMHWAIEGYERKLRLEIDKVMEYQLSPYFLVEPNGHKAQVVLELNGNHHRNPERSAMVAHIVFFTDDMRTKEFKDEYYYRASFTLLNLKGNAKDIVMTNAFTYDFSFTLPPFRRLKRNGFIVDDVLIYKARVEKYQRFL